MTPKYINSRQELAEELQEHTMTIKQHADTLTDMIEILNKIQNGGDVTFTALSGFKNLAKESADAKEAYVSIGKLLKRRASAIMFSDDDT